PLLVMMEKEKKLGAVQSLILMDQEKDVINSCGNALHYLGFGYTRGYRKKKDEWRCETTTKIGYTSGAAVLLRASALQIVGLFDDTYFMYHEDSDLCWRMRLARYEVAVCTDSIVYHHYEFSRSIQKFTWIERNRLMNLLKNYQLRTLFLIAPLFFFWEVGMLFYSLLGSILGKRTIGFKEKLQGYAYFFKIKTWKHIRSERKKIAALRRIADKDIVQYLESTIEFQDISNPLITYIANPLTGAYWFVVKGLL
ncbi:MAG: hypothetical protein Q7R79_00885, partial [bacterium]|nr:hypothetical protein [bacterium]